MATNNMKSITIEIPEADILLDVSGGSVGILKPWTVTDVVEAYNRQCKSIDEHIRLYSEDMRIRYALNVSEIDNLGVYNLVDVSENPIKKIANVWIVKQSKSERYMSNNIELVDGLYRTRSETTGNTRLVLVKDNRVRVLGNPMPCMLPAFFNVANKALYRIDAHAFNTAPVGIAEAMEAVRNGRVVLAVTEQGKHVLAMDSDGNFISSLDSAFLEWTNLINVNISYQYYIENQTKHPIEGV